MDAGQPTAMTDGLLEWLAEVANDPLAFTLGAYPWGEPGTVLEDYTGCKSWIDLQLKPELASALPCKPVLDDAAYQALADKVRAQL